MCPETGYHLDERSRVQPWQGERGNFLEKRQGVGEYVQRSVTRRPCRRLLEIAEKGARMEWTSRLGQGCQQVALAPERWSRIAGAAAAGPVGCADTKREDI